eukprot:scaffold76001_cov30-Tisochrysis_lutea.AAC.5
MRRERLAWDGAQGIRAPIASNCARILRARRQDKLTTANRCFSMLQRRRSGQWPHERQATQRAHTCAASAFTGEVG